MRLRRSAGEVEKEGRDTIGSSQASLRIIVRLLILHGVVSWEQNILSWHHPPANKYFLETKLFFAYISSSRINTAFAKIVGRHDTVL